MQNFVSIVLEENDVPFSSYEKEQINEILKTVAPFQIVELKNSPNLSNVARANLRKIVLDTDYTCHYWVGDAIVDLLFSGMTQDEKLKFRDEYFKIHTTYLGAFLKHNVSITYKQYKELYFKSEELQLNVVLKELNATWLGKQSVNKLFEFICQPSAVEIPPKKLLIVAKKYVAECKNAEAFAANFPKNGIQATLLEKLDYLNNIFVHQKFNEGAEWIRSEVYSLFKAVGVESLDSLAIVNKTNRELILKLTEFWKTPSRLGIQVPDAVERRVHIVMAQTTISTNFQKGAPASKFCSRVFGSKGKLQFEKDDLEAGSKKLKKMLNMSLYDYLCQHYFEQYSRMIPCTLEEFKAEYPKLYSLRVFMTYFDTIIAWVCKEFEIDSGLIHYLEHHQLFDFENYYSNMSPGDISGHNQVKSQRVSLLVSEHLAYVIGNMIRTLKSLQYENVPFTGAKFKEIVKCMYPEFECKKTPKQLEGSFHIQKHRNDPCSPSLYIKLFSKGVNAEHINLLNLNDNNRSHALEQLATFIDQLPVKSATNIQQAVKFFKEIPSTVKSSGWAADMLSSLKDKQGDAFKLPPTFSDLLKEWANIQPLDKEVVIRIMKNDIELSKGDDNELTDIEEWEDLFERMKEFQPKTHSSFPNIQVQKGNIKAYILPPGDSRALIIGTMTGCCQHIGGAAKSVAISSFTNPNHGVFVVETDKGQILAQSLIWTGKMRNRPRKKFKGPNFNKQVIAFDSVESSFMDIDDDIHFIDEIVEAYASAFKLLQAEGYAVAINFCEDPYMEIIYDESNLKAIELELECEEYDNLGYSDFTMENAYILCL